MANGYEPDWGRIKADHRWELHKILHWLSEPVTSQKEYLLKFAVKCYLHGLDAKAEIMRKFGVESYQAKLFAERGRVWIMNERAKRRSKTREILEARSKWQSPKFTSENMRVTMRNLAYKDDPTMQTVAIYAVVEVYHEDELEKDYLVNFSDFKTKEWLTRLLVWGLMNQREITLKPATEFQLANMRMFVPRDKVPA